MMKNTEKTKKEKMETENNGSRERKNRERENKFLFKLRGTLRACVWIMRVKLRDRDIHIIYVTSAITCVRAKR